MEIIKPGTNLNFAKYRGAALVVSVSLVAASLFGILVWPKPNAGIDFTGGTEIEVLFKQPVDVGELRKVAESLDKGETRVQETSGLADKGSAYLIRVEAPLDTDKEEDAESVDGGAMPHGVTTTPSDGASVSEHDGDTAKPLPGDTAAPAEGDTAAPVEGATTAPGEGSTAAPAPGDTAEAAPVPEAKPEKPEVKRKLSELEKALIEKYGEGTFEVVKTDFVGPRVGEDLRNRGMMAIGLALFLILVYITLRFEFRFAVGAVLALAHDVAITTGAFVWTHKEFNLAIIAALLSIIGYSLNDTIVLFDRVRENTKRMRRLSFAEMINSSINEVLSRTILTSATTLVVVFFLWFFGSGVISDFAFALIVGVIVGTYSSIFVAGSFVIWWESIREKRRSPVVDKSK